jgi:hypothetical protein
MTPRRAGERRWRERAVYASTAVTKTSAASVVHRVMMTHLLEKHLRLM